MDTDPFHYFTPDMMICAGAHEEQNMREMTQSLMFAWRKFEENGVSVIDITGIMDRLPHKAANSDNLCAPANDANARALCDGLTQVFEFASFFCAPRDYEIYERLVARRDTIYHDPEARSYRATQLLEIAGKTSYTQH